MTKILVAVAAAVGIAIAAPSFAATSATHGPKAPVVKHKVVQKHKLVRKHKALQLHCKKGEKIELVNGKKQCVAR